MKNKKHLSLYHFITLSNKQQMKKLIFTLLIFTSATAFSQKEEREKPVKEKDTNKGFEIFFNAGMYWGNKHNADYYRGKPDPIDRNYADPDMSYIFGNHYLVQRIRELIREGKHKHDIIDDSIRYLDFSNMKYNLAFSFGIGLRYRFSESFTMSFLFSQIGLTAQGVATFGMWSRLPNLDKETQYIDYPIIGRERRIFLEMNASYLFETTHPSIFPFLELGVHMNNVKVSKCELIVEDRPFSMIDRYGVGTSYDPYLTYSEINPMLGGIGFGIVGGIGIKIAFNQWASLEPVFQVSTEKLQLSSFGKMRLNYNFMIRLVAGDKLFRKGEKTNNE
jgi:hypothetical protein